MKKLLRKLFRSAVTVSASVMICISALSACSDKEAENVQADTEEKNVFVPVIMYHSVLKDESSWGEYVISPDVLKNDIEYLKTNGYEFILTSDLIDYVYSGSPLPEKPVILTFDDGCYNFLTYVEPLLRENGAKAVLSVVGAYAENEEGKLQSSGYSYLNFSQIKELSKCGYIEIASHSYDMHKLGLRQGALMKDGETPEQYKSAFISDLLLNTDCLKNNCGVIPNVYTYPYGFICEDSIEYVKGCGFLASYGVEEKPNYISHDPECLYCMNRYNRPSGVSTEEFMSKALSR